MRNKSLKEAMLLNVRDYLVLLSARTLQSCCIIQRLSASQVDIYIHTTKGSSPALVHPERWELYDLSLSIVLGTLAALYKTERPRTNLTCQRQIVLRPPDMRLRPSTI